MQAPRQRPHIKGDTERQYGAGPRQPSAYLKTKDRTQTQTQAQIHVHTHTHTRGVGEAASQKLTPPSALKSTAEKATSSKTRDRDGREGENIARR